MTTPPAAPLRPCPICNPNNEIKIRMGNEICLGCGEGWGQIEDNYAKLEQELSDESD